MPPKKLKWKEFCFAITQLFFVVISIPLIAVGVLLKKGTECDIFSSICKDGSSRFLLNNSRNFVPNFDWRSSCHEPFKNFLFIHTKQKFVSHWNAFYLINMKSIFGIGSRPQLLELLKITSQPTQNENEQRNSRLKNVADSKEKFEKPVRRWSKISKNCFKNFFTSF